MKTKRWLFGLALVALAGVSGCCHHHTANYRPACPPPCCPTPAAPCCPQPGLVAPGVVAPGVVPGVAPVVTPVPPGPAFR